MWDLILLPFFWGPHSHSLLSSGLIEMLTIVKEIYSARVNVLMTKIICPTLSVLFHVRLTVYFLPSSFS